MPCVQCDEASKDRSVQKTKWLSSNLTKLKLNQIGLKKIITLFTKAIQLIQLFL